MLKTIVNHVNTSKTPKWLLGEVSGKPIPSDEFKKLTLEILRRFSKVCDANNLRYALDYGTLLGAIRHGGFIPWDDDIDVTMPREDYNKLLTLANANDDLFGNYYKLAVANGKYNVFKSYINIIDIRTTTLSPHRRRGYYYPVWIDVFPLDHSTLDDERLREAYKKIANLRLLTTRAMLPFGGKKKILRRAFILINSPFISKRLAKMDSIASSFNACGKLSSLLSPYGIKDCTSSDYYDNLITKDFEGYSFKVSSKWEDRLKTLYGDYMLLPPIEKRKQHVNAAYWVD